VADLGERIAVVTGASSGIGEAIAVAFAGRGLRPYLVGRNPERLKRVAEVVAARGGESTTLQADLRTDDGVSAVIAAVEAAGRLDLLVHAAGVIRLGEVTTTTWEDLDELYQVNVRAPYLLTRALLPLLVTARGQIVFINSTAGLRPSAHNFLYAATKHALASLAEGIRSTATRLGVRVTSVYPGRTATRMQEQVHAFERKTYCTASLLHPNEVADLVVSAVMRPNTTEVTDVVVRPAAKSPDARSSR
jgi:NADP-dependent 3-hydroxy acid dehydrogenase YdfG